MLAARVVVLANGDDPDSVRIAEHYAAVRGVPTRNVLALPLPSEETVSWHDFVTGVWEPLMARLVQDGWIDAIPMDLTDPVGRRKYAVQRHRIAALVVCRGVPLRIAHDATLYSDVFPFTTHPEFRTNAAAVDGELSLLAVPNHPINAFIPNPLFQQDRPSEFDAQQVVKVSRLDGPTVGDAFALVDRAVAAEASGLQGRAYVDLSDRDPVGNAWLESTAAQLDALGFEPAVDRAPATLPPTARIDAPVLYFGWYASDLNGPFLLPGFRFPPGAIALHIHSYSAATLRSATTGWTGPLVARGVTATVGNVYEPYLQLTHRPDLLLRALARGETLVDAAYYALEALSWQEVLIGDPLYRPLAADSDARLRAAEQHPVAGSEYVVLRAARRRERAGHAAEAIALLRRWQTEHPSLPVGIALAERLRARGDLAGAGSALALAPVPERFAPTEWGLAADAARRLLSCGRAARAVELWHAVLDDERLPAELRASWAGEAAATARAARDPDVAARWERLAPNAPGGK